MDDLEEDNELKAEIKEKTGGGDEDDDDGYGFGAVRRSARRKPVNAGKAGRMLTKEFPEEASDITVPSKSGRKRVRVRNQRAAHRKANENIDRALRSLASKRGRTR